MGSPQFPVTGAPFVISAGTEPWGQNQTYTPEVSHCIAYTPPPLLLNEVPYAFAVVVVTPHPFPALPALQLELLSTVPPWEPDMLIEQPADVCNVISLVDWVLTPSMMSISPPAGQFGPTSQ